MSPSEIVSRMMERDAFSQWLGIEVLEVKEKYCRLQMKVRNEMLNGFGISHGGITYSLADSALAFASNTCGRKSVSIETSIHHLEKTNAGDMLQAEAQCEYESEKFAHYIIRISKILNKDYAPVAFFKGIVYKTSSEWK